MKKQVKYTSILLISLMMVLSACHTRSRENIKTAKPTEVVKPDDQNPTEPTNPDDANPIDPLPDDEPTPVDHALKDGDIIFQKSQSKQSSAIREASGSEWTHVGILVSKDDQWYVAEAIGPVVTTPLQDFINRGKDKEYKIFRYKHFDATTMEDSLISAIKKQNKAYDIYFEISDENTYCSELVYKAMLEATGHELGRIQQFKDLKLNGPYVQAMIKKRLTDKGRTLNPDELIITPASQMQDPNLILIKEFLKEEHL